MVSARNLFFNSASISQITSGWQQEASPNRKVRRPTRIKKGFAVFSYAVAAISEIKKTVPNANISFLQMDLTSFSSIKAAAAKVNADPSAQLHILMLNAGIMAVAPGLTEDGYEIQFGTNHVGHALLTKLLLPTLRKTAASDANADVRIVTLASEAENKMPTQGPGINLDGIKKADGGGLSTFQRYSQSKIANVLYTRALAQREVAVDEGKSNRIKHIVVHPGMVKTNLGKPDPTRFSKVK